jgi:hypothetical protein
MLLLSHIASQTYALAWLGVLLIVAYYTVMTAVFRWRPQQRVWVAQYEPPPGISPAIAACLFENGRCERAFATALVSLATKGYLSIQQKKDWFTLGRLREPDASLPPEEAVALASLFPTALDTYTFNGIEYHRLSKAYRDFATTVEGITESELISPHTGPWLFGVAYSTTVPVGVILTVPNFAYAGSALSLVFCGLCAVLGGSCLVAAVRIWPATLRKMLSFLPFNGRPSRPLSLNDLAPVFLTVSGLLGFAFLAVSTSTQFALLMTALVLLHTVARHALETPTAAGRKVLAELRGFREFLSRAEADRLNRENRPGQTPQVLEERSAYAVALDVEHAWGEEFSEELMELLQYEQAYDPWPMFLPYASEDRIELKINSKK